MSAAHRLRVVAAALLLAACVLPATADTKRDPLNNAEIDELRDTAQEPQKRIPLFVTFVRARAVKLEQLANDPRIVTDRASQIHDLLEDIDTLVQEMDDNIDMYVKQNADLRKALKTVIDMDTELQAKLRDMKTRQGDANTTREVKSYRFALDNALESATSSLENARDVLKEQEVAMKDKGKKK